MTEGKIDIIPFTPSSALEAAELWNEIVAEGRAFPQTELLDAETGRAFFEEQSFTGLAYGEDGRLAGLYILHPNNVGRCGHICNASYAVARAFRGRGIGEALVRHSIAKGASLGFRVLQFNAVVASNKPALALYEKLGFIRLGTIPGGFLAKSGEYEDIIPHYILL
ncbi:MAG: GNAT family N-acetyltransferase [Bacteroides sp.]|nr:GNAT family N-acetyltransferase [Eubacterium sp.]MCM1418969.1 GNAT family N-acetyltransferase [Roseburia sp.]MCM1463641.1 GNAT family N-acetyltransferase [Bacteroides sp.]